MKNQNYEPNDTQTESRTYYDMPDPSSSQDPFSPSGSVPSPEPVHENVIAGIVGAFLFSLAGGVLYFLICQLGYIAGICGLITVVVSIFGYQLFSGRKNSLKGVIIAIIISILSIVLAEYLGLSYEYYKYFNKELGIPISLTDAIRVTPELLAETEVLAAFLKDLAVALVLGIIASFSSIKNAIAESRNH